MVLSANGALLILQIVAGRLLAPVIGSSLETWTAVIGTFLSGISIGNWYGGKLADRSASGKTLRRLLWLGAIATLWALLLSRLAVQRHWLGTAPLLARIATLNLACFLPVAFVLSMTTPVAIKLLLPDVRQTGRVVGAVYAIGTLGSLAGNFLAGFYLIAEFSVTAIVLAVAGALALLAGLIPRWQAAPPEVEAFELGSSIVERPIRVITACFTVFVASFCAMALEMIASRLIAASHGVSIYTWTGIIGVVLAGTIIGNWLGGWVADRMPRRATLGASLFWAGALSGVIILTVSAAPSLMIAPSRLPDDAPVWQRWMFDAGVSMSNYLNRWNSSPLPWQIIGAAAAMFFLPMIAFGSISPQATRLAVSDWQHAGRVAGRVYAWSCAGAIAGTFAAGWLLIGALGSLFLILIIAAVMMLAALIVGGQWRHPVELVGICVVLAILGLVTSFGVDRYLSLRPNAEYVKESNYYLIGISQRDDSVTGESHLVMVLDQLIHSRIYGAWSDDEGRRAWKTDVSRLGYGHEWVQSEFARMASAKNEQPRAMIIGGGGYTLPRWLDKYMPRMHVDVVEIDPAVTEAVYRFLGMPRDTKIQTHNMDGRQFVQEHAKPGSYHLIIQDAVNDLSVPYHMMTREYNQAIRRALTPDGVYLLTVIDEPNGRFLNAAIRTMQASFPHVSVLGDWAVWTSRDRGVYVIAGTPEPFDMDKLQQVLARQGITESKTVMMPPQELQALLDRAKPIILTDDYAPVDNLIAETFRKRNEPDE